MFHLINRTSILRLKDGILLENESNDFSDLLLKDLVIVFNNDQVEEINSDYINVKSFISFGFKSEYLNNEINDGRYIIKI